MRFQHLYALLSVTRLTPMEQGGDIFPMTAIKNELMRKLPKIDVLAEFPPIAAASAVLGRPAVVDACRRGVESAKLAAKTQGIAPDFDRVAEHVVADLEREKGSLLRPVINGTGVLLHTNLGRAPLGDELFQEMASLVSGYCNLEIDVEQRQRGVRAPGVAELLRRLCGAEDSVVVNNNAAALFLALSALAKGKEVIVSRGELVQIGGGFRILDILQDSGAILVEVGATNITTTEDYAGAVTEATALVLSVHRANFTMSGFVRAPSLSEIRSAVPREIPLISDLGSGNFLREAGGRRIAEPTPEDALRQGADLVCFSCDKMLGGTQAGVAAGSGPLVRTLKKHPVMRVVRPGKLTFAALQVVLTRYLSDSAEALPLWRAASLSVEDLRLRVRGFVETQGLNPEVFVPSPMDSTFGGGAGPEERIPSFGLKIRCPRAEVVAEAFQRRVPPIVGRIADGCLVLDFRTIDVAEEDSVGEACRESVPTV